MLIFFYNLIMPVVFLFLLPSLLIKQIKRSGYKKTYSERFGIFGSEAQEKLNNLSNPVWIHSVSVGETQIAINFIKKWKEQEPEKKFVLSTTTTTGQALARENAPEDIIVIFCPIDFSWAVKRTLKLIKPEILILFETEIWPNMIYQSYRLGVKVVQVNARISDHSFEGYKRFRYFVRPFLSKLTLSCAQTELDVERLKTICPSLNVVETGTMKFDQKIPEKFIDLNLDEVFGKNKRRILLAASTHPDEEKFIASIFIKLVKEFNDLKFVEIPRHAERGNDIAGIFKSMGIKFHQRSKGGKPEAEVNCLLADTTGEMVSFINEADIVIVGKSFAGNDEGQNIIEPAIMEKTVVVGPQLKNFRQVLDIMKKSNSIVSVPDEDLESSLRKLLENPEGCRRFGETARETVMKHIGTTQRTIDIIREKVL